MGLDSQTLRLRDGFHRLVVELLAITRHIAFDFSAWATGANNDKTHDTQTRATLGVGITF